MTVTTDIERPRDLRGTLLGVAALVLKNARSLYWRHADLIAILALVLFAAVTVVFTFLRPVYNWDVLAYLGATVKDGVLSNAEIQAYAYGVVKAAVPPEAFIGMTETSSYGLRQMTDPDAFVSMIGMYETKWFYISLMKWLTPFVGAYNSTYVINFAALLILITTTGLWLRATGLSAYAPLVIGLYFMLEFSGFHATQQPDFFSNSLLIASLLSYERKRNVQGAALMLLTILTRPDQVATAGVLMACGWLLRDRATPIFAATFVLGLLGWFLIGQVTDGVPYWTQIWFTTYQAQDTLVGFNPEFSPLVYILAVGFNIYRALFQNTWLAAYGIAIAWAGYLYFNAAIIDRRRQVLLLAMLLAVAAKFTVFPLSDGRIYFAPLAVFFMIAFASWLDSRKSAVPA